MAPTGGLAPDPPWREDPAEGRCECVAKLSKIHTTYEADPTMDTSTSPISMRLASCAPVPRPGDSSHNSRAGHPPPPQRGCRVGDPGAGCAAPRSILPVFSLVAPCHPGAALRDLYNDSRRRALVVGVVVHLDGCGLLLRVRRGAGSSRRPSAAWAREPDAVPRAWFPRLGAAEQLRRRVDRIGSIPRRSISTGSFISIDSAGCVATGVTSATSPGPGLRQRRSLQRSALEHAQAAAAIALDPQESVTLARFQKIHQPAEAVPPLVEAALGLAKDLFHVA